jgi:hypothetical protein
MTEQCLESGRSIAQARLSEVPVRDQQLDAEVQRLAQDNPEFRRAVHGFQTTDLRYDEARGVAASGVRVAASIIDGGRPSIPSGLSVQGNGLARPEPIDLATPESPWSRTGAGALREGWVKLRFSVLADGRTADVQVVDAMPPGLEASTASAAAEAWTFEPATADGRPVDWHNNLAVVTVRREQDIHEGWLGFAEAYEAVAVLAADQRYEEAKSRNARMSEMAATLEEMAFAAMQLAGLEHASGDSHAALDAIRRATEPAVDQLADEQLKLALEHRFGLEIEFGLAADALSSFERWSALGGRSRDSMTRLGTTLRETLAAPETNLAAVARIGAGERREHALTWPTFAVGDVDGQVDGLELVCNRNRAVLPFEPDVQMTIPAGWGECVLVVEGRPDTSFVVYELREPIG